MNRARPGVGDGKRESFTGSCQEYRGLNELLKFRTFCKGNFNSVSVLPLKLNTAANILNVLITSALEDTPNKR